MLRREKKHFEPFNESYSKGVLIEQVQAPIESAPLGVEKYSEESDDGFDRSEGIHERARFDTEQLVQRSNNKFRPFSRKATRLAVIASIIGVGSNLIVGVLPGDVVLYGTTFMFAVAGGIWFRGRELLSRVINAKNRVINRGKERIQREVDEDLGDT